MTWGQTRVRTEGLVRLVSGIAMNWGLFQTSLGLGAGRRRTPKISRPAGQDFGPADMGGGGGGRASKQVGGGVEKRSERPWPLWGRGE